MEQIVSCGSTAYHRMGFSGCDHVQAACHPVRTHEGDRHEARKFQRAEVHRLQWYDSAVTCYAASAK